MKIRTIAALSVLFLAASLCAAEDAKPDFSGKWVLDVGKSDFGMLPGPDSRTDVIEHKEPKLKITTTAKSQQGERTSERNLTTDGQENSNTQGPLEIKSTSHWEGKQLVTQAKFEIQGNAVELKEVWELAGDGKLLTIKRNFKSPQGETDQKLLLDKQ